MVHFLVHGNGEFDAKHPIGPCLWPHFDLLAIRSGKVWIRFQHQDRVELSAGQAVLVYPDTHFAGQSICPLSRATVMHFSLDQAHASAPCSMPQPLQRLRGRSKGFELYSRPIDRVLAQDIQRAVRMAQRPRSARGRELRAAMLVLILGQLQAHRPSHRVPEEMGETSERFSPLIQWAAARLDRPPTLREMAEFAGMSASHFRAIFTRRFGEAPGHFLQRLRYSEATRLLRETRLPIKQIAPAVGFADLAHFYRFFAIHDSLTPLEYRTRHQVQG